MTTTTFVTGVTVIEADWLNDVDAATYDQSTGVPTKNKNYPFYS